MFRKPRLSLGAAVGEALVARPYKSSRGSPYPRGARCGICRARVGSQSPLRAHAISELAIMFVASSLRPGRGITGIVPFFGCGGAEELESRLVAETNSRTRDYQERTYEWCDARAKK